MEIFYKSLNFEKISSHEAFPSISLLSEIGGFMGLLLGASALTVFEVVDFIALLVYKRLRKKSVAPSGGSQPTL